MSKYDCELNLEDKNSLSVLLSRIKPNSMVLEFGPANGRMTKYMKEQLNCKVFAVEIDESSARDAEKYTKKIIVDNIENYKWKEEFKGLQFDYIIFADVLEHLYYPEKALESVNEFLKEDGSILVSIPNIAHNAIVLGLLKNEFNYSPTGLLDDTHIRFFTKKTFDKLIEKVGYFRSYETAIFINPENTEFGNSYNEVIPEFAEHLRNLSCGEIYQLIYEIKKHKVETVSDYSERYKVYSQNFIQLFIDQGNGISEKNSIKLPVSQNSDIQKFEFDLKDFQNITNLRLDPLNDSCVIEIEKISLVLIGENEINLTANISTNANYIKDNLFYFGTKDSNIYFSDFDFSSNDIHYLKVELKYKTIGSEVLDIIIKETKGELEQTKGELLSVFSSRSWKITKPLRKIKEIVKRD